MGKFFKCCLILSIASQVMMSCSNKEMVGRFQIGIEDNNSIVELYNDSTFREEENENNEAYHGSWRLINEQDLVIELTTEGSGLTEVYTKMPRRFYRVKNGRLEQVERK